MTELTTTYKTREEVNVPVSFTKSELLTGDKKPYILLNNEKYQISLFPVKVKPDNGKKSFIKYNALVTFKKAHISFSVAIRELTENGSLIAGQAGRLAGNRAVVTEWDAARGIAYERLSIPNEQYHEIMAIVAEATNGE